MDSLSKFLADILPQQRRKSPYYSVLDIYKVNRYLAYVLLPEIAEIILDHAEFWVGTRSQRTDSYTVLAEPGVQDDATTYYLVSDPVPMISIEGRIRPMRVRRIRFTLDSHDQGWGGEANLRGPYHGSYTWFEAGILKPGDYELPKGVFHSADIDRQAFDSGPTSYEVPFPQPETDSVTGARRWFLQSNIRASRKRRTHVVEWNSDESCDSARIQDLITAGTGHGQGFLELLQPGHRVAVLARAKYPLWGNYVYRVTVELFFHILTPSN